MSPIMIITTTTIIIGIAIMNTDLTDETASTERT